MSALYTSIQEQLQNISAYVSSFLLRLDPRALKSLKWLVAIGLAIQVNSLLNALALNHWSLRRKGKKWMWTGHDELAVVTGGSSGFGHLITKGLAPAMKVAVLDLQEMPKDLQALSNVKFYKCDITSSKAVSETAAAIRQDMGMSPSILINNAGIAHAHSILDTSEEWLEKVFRVNLFSHFILIKEFLPKMLEQQKGHIVSIASLASFVSGAGLVDYSATKAAVLSLHQGLNQELRHRYSNGRTIQTSIVHPTYAQTPLIGSFGASLQSSRAMVVSPSDVADAVVRQVLLGSSAQLFVPSSAQLASGISGWSHWLQERFRDTTAKSTPA